MKREAIILALLYGLILVMLIAPVSSLAFIGSESTKLSLDDLFATWSFWVWLVIMIASQAALLALPVNVASKRPIGKAPLLLSIVAGALMMGFLLAGVIFAIAESMLQETAYKPTSLIILAGLVLMWVLWSCIFYRWSKGAQPCDFIDKQCRALFRGSVLQLLIVVPAHVYVRQKDYCCAGYGTFFGIAFGLSVMLFSFGPGVFFLYRQLIERKRSGCA